MASSINNLTFVYVVRKHNKIVWGTRWLTLVGFFFCGPLYYSYIVLTTSQIPPV